MICPNCKDLPKKSSGFKRIGDILHTRYICPNCRTEFYDPPLPEEKEAEQ